METVKQLRMKKLDKPVLAEGEATGHAHVLDADVDVYEQNNGTRTFTLPEESTLVHEEHKPIVLPKRAWVSGIAQEYDHFEEEARRVQD